MLRKTLDKVADGFFTAMLWLAAVLIAGYLMVGLAAVTVLRRPLRVLQARVSKGEKK